MILTTQLTAVFDDRDGADLALMRLRRNGIDYSIAELKAPEKKPAGSLGMAENNMSYGLSAGSAVSPGEMYAAVLGSRAVMQRSAVNRGRSKLTLNVNSEQVLRARAIICSVKGRIL